MGVPAYFGHVSCYCSASVSSYKIRVLDLITLKGPSVSQLCRSEAEHIGRARRCFTQWRCVLGGELILSGEGPVVGQQVCLKEGEKSGIRRRRDRMRLEVHPLGPGM